MLPDVYYLLQFGLNIQITIIQKTEHFMSGVSVTPLEIDTHLSSHYIIFVFDMKYL